MLKISCLTALCSPKHRLVCTAVCSQDNLAGLWVQDSSGGDPGRGEGGSFEEVGKTFWCLFINLFTFPNKDSTATLKCQLLESVILILVPSSYPNQSGTLRDSVSQHSRRQVGGGLTETSVWADITTLTSEPRVWSIPLIPLIHPPPLASIPLDVVKGMVTVPPCS